MAGRLFILFFLLLYSYTVSLYAEPGAGAKIDSKAGIVPKKPAPAQNENIRKVLEQQKKMELKRILDNYKESPAYRFKTYFFIAFPFSLLFVIGSIQIYGLTMSGSSKFRMTGSHSASVILGSSFLSFAVALKGYSRYKERRSEVFKKIQGNELGLAPPGAPSNTEFMATDILLPTNSIQNDIQFNLAIAYFRF